MVGCITLGHRMKMNSTLLSSIPFVRGWYQSDKLPPKCNLQNPGPRIPPLMATPFPLVLFASASIR